MTLTVWTTRETLTAEERKRNYGSHVFGVVDDCVRCLDCEIGIWNGERELCPADGRGGTR